VRTFKENDLVLLYDNKFEKFPGKLGMHWLGTYVIKEVIDGGAVQLTKLNGDPFPGRVNGSILKLHMGGSTALLTAQGIVSPLQPVGRERETIKQSREKRHDCQDTRKFGQSQRSQLREKECVDALLRGEVTVAVTIHDKMSTLWQKGAGGG